MYNTKVICSYNTPNVFLETDMITDKDKEFIRDVLARQGFHPHIYEDRGKFVLCLYGKSELKRFYASIPVLRKKKRLSFLLDSF